MATETVVNVYDDVFKNLRKAAETNLKMQQEVFKQWGAMWPGFPAPQSVWLDKVRDFQHQWAATVSELARKHRDVLDRQYQAALESLDEALRVAEATSPEDFRERSEQLVRKTLDCVREISEAQMNEFKEALNQWSELATKTSK